MMRKMRRGILPLGDSNMFGFPGGAFAAAGGDGYLAASGARPLEDNNYALEYGGSDGQVAGWVNLEQPATLDFAPDTDSFSISAWVKRPEAPDFSRCIISKARMGAGGDISVFIGSDDEGAVYVLCGGGENTSGGDISDGEWHLVTFTVIAGEGSLYVDEDQVGSTFSVGAEQNMDADWLIGAARFDDNADSSYEWRGYIDEVTFWDEALSAPQVVELFGGGAPVDPTTHTAAADLLDWYRMGDADVWPTIADQVGSNDGTAENTPGIRLVEHSPTHTPTDFAAFANTDAVWRFNANDWTSGNWTAAHGAYTGVIDAGAGPTKSASTFGAGHQQLTVNRLFRIANAAIHAVDADFVGTFIFRIYTGALDGSGGFFAGYTGGGFDGAQHYNLFYAKDYAFRLRKADDSGDQLAVEAHKSQHANKYVEVAVTIDMTAPLVIAYALGSELGRSSSLDGGYSPPATAPFGLGGCAYTDATGFPSNASGGKILEAVFYNRVLTPNEIARSAAAFNALKGYV